MAIPPSPIPPEVLYQISGQLEKLVEAQRGTEVATLTGAIIAAMGRPVSLDEVMQIRRDVAFTLYSTLHTTNVYKEWKEKRKGESSTVYK